MSPLVVELVAAAIAALAVLFAARCYLELRRWARACQRAQLAIANKGKVQLTASLVELVEWATQLKSHGHAGGQVFYRNGRVSVAIVRPKQPALEVVKRNPLARVAGRFRRSTSSAAAA